MRMTVGEVSAATGGEITRGDASLVIDSFTNDSRALGRHACFVALRDHRDGHDFVHEAFRLGAVAALVDRIPADGRAPAGVAMIRVPDVLVALADLGRSARHRLPDATVVGITGSAGKTSTKDLTVAALGRRLEVHANVASFNNEIGLPLTLLGAGERTDVIVTEMGARFAGNIRDLCAIARPSVGVITHVGMAHAEHLGGAVDIAAVKGELLEALPPDGLAVLNADDDATPGLAARSAAPVLQVGIAARADLRVSDVRLDETLRPTFRLDTAWGAGTIRLGVRGEHQVVNAAMAAAVALSLEVPFEDMRTGLADATGSTGRMQLEHAPGGVIVLDDCYNASPTSMQAALRSLARLRVTGRRVAVLGEMRELGSHGADEHARIGALAAVSGVDLLVAVGPGVGALAGAARASGTVEVLEVADAAAALAVLAQRVCAGDAVLVKASRAVHLERVAHPLVAGLVRVGEGAGP